MAKRSFEKDLWEGVKVVYERYEEGKRTLSETIKFFNDRIEADSSFGKDLLKLHSRGGGVQEKGTVGETWNALKRAQENCSKVLTDQVAITKRDIIQPLETLKKNQAVQKESLEKRITAQVKALEKGRENLTKAKQKFHSACREAERALVSYEKAQQDPQMQSAKLTKLNTSQQQLKKDAEVADAQYRMTIKEFNVVLATYETEMKRILLEFQEMEQRRLEQIVDVLRKWISAQSSFQAGFEMCRVSLSKAVDATNPSADIQAFIEENKTGENPPPPAIYEPYVPETPSGAAVIPHPPNEAASPAGSSASLVAGGGSRTAAAAPAAASRASDGRATPTAPVNSPNKTAGLGSSTTSGKGGSQINTATGTKIDLKSLKFKCRAKAVFDYTAGDDTELTFAVGDMIDVFNMDESGWWEGVFNGKVGMFPGNHVEKTEDLPATPAAASAPAAATPKTASTPAAATSKSGSATAAAVPAASASPAATKKEEPAASARGTPTASPAAAPAAKKEEPKKEEPPVRKCKILFDFAGEAPDELPVKEGQVVIIEQEVEGWFIGRNDKGKTGMFPANFAQVL